MPPLPKNRYTVTAQKFKYTVIFYLNTTLCLPMFIRLILLKDSLFSASKAGVIKYRAVVKDNNYMHSSQVSLRNFFLSKTDRCHGIQMKYITVYLNFWAVTVAVR